MRPGRSGPGSPSARGSACRTPNPRRRRARRRSRSRLRRAPRGPATCVHRPSVRHPEVQDVVVLDPIGCTYGSPSTAAVPRGGRRWRHDAGRGGRARVAAVGVAGRSASSRPSSARRCSTGSVGGWCSPRPARPWWSPRARCCATSRPGGPRSRRSRASPPDASTSSPSRPWRPIRSRPSWGRSGCVPRRRHRARRPGRRRRAGRARGQRRVRGRHHRRAGRRSGDSPATRSCVRTSSRSSPGRERVAHHGGRRPRALPPGDRTRGHDDTAPSSRRRSPRPGVHATHRGGHGTTRRRSCRSCSPAPGPPCSPARWRNRRPRSARWWCRCDPASPARCTSSTATDLSPRRPPRSAALARRADRTSRRQVVGNPASRQAPNPPIEIGGAVQPEVLQARGGEARRVALGADHDHLDVVVDRLGDARVARRDRGAIRGGCARSRARRGSRPRRALPRGPRVDEQRAACDRGRRFGRGPGAAAARARRRQQLVDRDVIAARRAPIAAPSARSRCSALELALRARTIEVHRLQRRRVRRARWSPAAADGFTTRCTCPGRRRRAVPAGQRLLGEATAPPRRGRRSPAARRRRRRARRPSHRGRAGRRPGTSPTRSATRRSRRAPPRRRNQRSSGRCCTSASHRSRSCRELRRTPSSRAGESGTAETCAARGASDEDHGALRSSASDRDGRASAAISPRARVRVHRGEWCTSRRRRGGRAGAVGASDDDDSARRTTGARARPRGRSSAGPAAHGDAR